MRSIPALYAAARWQLPLPSTGAQLLSSANSSCHWSNWWAIALRFGCSPCFADWACSGSTAAYRKPRAARSSRSRHSGKRPVDGGFYGRGNQEKVPFPGGSEGAWTSPSGRVPRLYEWPGAKRTLNSILDIHKPKRDRWRGSIRRCIFAERRPCLLAQSGGDLVRPAQPPGFATASFHNTEQLRAQYTT